KHYLLVNKPRGYVTTLADPQGRPVVADLADVGARLYPVGRLDRDVEGLLLLTNDGALTNRLLHPRYALPPLYAADAAGRVAPGGRAPGAVRRLTPREVAALRAAVAEHAGGRRVS